MLSRFPRCGNSYFTTPPHPCQIRRTAFRPTFCRTLCTPDRLRFRAPPPSRPTSPNTRFSPSAQPCRPQLPHNTPTHPAGCTARRQHRAIPAFAPNLPLPPARPPQIQKRHSPQIQPFQPRKARLLTHPPKPYRSGTRTQFITPPYTRQIQHPLFHTTFLSTSAAGSNLGVRSRGPSPPSPDFHHLTPLTAADPDHHPPAP